MLSAFAVSYTRTFCVVTVTAFILVGNSVSVEVLSIHLLLRMVWKFLGQQSHSCIVILAVLWWCCFRYRSLYILHLVRNYSWWSGVVSVSKVGLVSG